MDYPLIDEQRENTIRELLPLACKEENADPSDPQKIWVILHYPDGINVTPCTLMTLLTNLSTHKDEALCMYKFEWTLSARVNSRDTPSNYLGDEPKKTVDESSIEKSLCMEAVEATNEETTSRIKATCILPPFPITNYFCVTAPVADHHVHHTNVNSLDYVVEHTPTVIVDLRYHFSCCKFTVKGYKHGRDIEKLMNDIAARVHDIVTSTLQIDDPKKYRVYVLKPQHQTLYGVSPTSHSRKDLGLTIEGLNPLEPLSVPNPPKMKKRKTSSDDKS